MIRYCIQSINLPSGGYRGQPVVDVVTLEQLYAYQPDGPSKIATFYEVLSLMCDNVKQGSRVVSNMMTMEPTISGSVPDVTGSFGVGDMSLNLKVRQSLADRFTTGLTLSKVDATPSTLGISYVRGLSDYPIPEVLGMFAYDQPLEVVGKNMKETPYSKVRVESLDGDGNVMAFYEMVEGFVTSTSGKVVVKMPHLAYDSYEMIMPYGGDSSLRLERVVGQVENATIQCSVVWMLMPAFALDADSNLTSQSIVMGIVQAVNLTGTGLTTTLPLYAPFRVQLTWNPLTQTITGAVSILTRDAPNQIIGVIDENLASSFEYPSGYTRLLANLPSGTDYTSPDAGELVMEIAIRKSQVLAYSSETTFHGFFTPWA